MSVLHPLRTAIMPTCPRSLSQCSLRFRWTRSSFLRPLPCKPVDVLVSCGRLLPNHCSGSRHGFVPDMGIATKAIPPVMASTSTVASPKGFGGGLKENIKPTHQAMDYTAVVGSVWAMRKWLPSRVEEVIQWNNSCVAIRLRVPDSQGWLHFSWDPKGARFCMGQAPKRGDISEAFSLGERLHAGLRGLILMDVVLPVSFERVIEFKFGKRQGGELECSLYCEIMGKYSNLLLIDSSSTILICARQVGAKLSSLRSLQDRGKYSLPPVQSGLLPGDFRTHQEWVDVVRRSGDVISQAKKRQQKGATVASSITKSFQGVSPNLSYELLQQCSFEPDIQIDEMSKDDWEKVFQQWLRWLEILETGGFQPSICSSSGRYSLLGTYDELVEDIHSLLDDFYKSSGEEDHFGQLHQRLRSCVNQNLKRLGKKVTQLEKVVSASEEASETQRKADLIMANIHKWKQGLSELVVEDWDSQESVTIQLDPTKTGIEYAQGLYTRAKKQKRGGNITAPLLEMAKGELDYMQEVEESLNQLDALGDGDDMRALEEIKEDLIKLKYMKAPREVSLSSKAASKAKKAKKKAAKGGAEEDSGQNGFRVATSPNGFRVLIGRNSRQNDELSKTVAKDNDLWFHVRGHPGSHVVLKLDGKANSPDREDIVFAAEAAAWFSKVREAGKVGVTKTLGKHVSKPRGAPPGLVQVIQEEVIVVKPRDVMDQ